MTSTNSKPGQLPDFYDKVSPGWVGLLERLHTRLAHYRPNYQVNDVQEKFGTIDVYVVDEDPAIWGMIAETWEKSSKTCNQCGGVGYGICHNGQWMTRCRTHKPGKVE